MTCSIQTLINEPGVITIGATHTSIVDLDLQLRGRGRGVAYPVDFSSFCVFSFLFLPKIRGWGRGYNEAIHEELLPLDLKRKYDDNRNLDIIVLNELSARNRTQSPWLAVKKKARQVHKSLKDMFRYLSADIICTEEQT